MLADMEAMTIRFVSAVPMDDGQSVRGRVRAESKLRRNGRPVASVSLVLLVPRQDESGYDRPLPERIYDEALRYLDIA